MSKKKNHKKEKKNDLIPVLKWGTIALVTTTGVVGGSYLFIKHVIQKNRQNNEYSDSTATNSKGKVSNATVGNGQTPSTYAQQINAALKATNWAGIPDTDEDTVYRLLRELKTQYEYALVAKSYQALYNKPLNKGFEDDLDADEFILATSIITSKPTK